MSLSLFFYPNKGVMEKEKSPLCLAAEGTIYKNTFNRSVSAVSQKERSKRKRNKKL